MGSCINVYNFVVVPKTCEHEGCNNPIWSRKTMRCKIHQTQKTPEKKKIGNNLKRTPIKKVSDKKSKRDKVYSVLRQKYLEENPICQICNSVPSTDIHHKHSGADRAKYQNDLSTWMALCRGCHTEIHENPKWARDNDYLV